MITLYRLLPYRGLRCSIYVVFFPGITTADLPCKNGGPVGSGRVTDLDLVLLRDRTPPLAKFTCYLTLVAALHALSCRRELPELLTAPLRPCNGPALHTITLRGPCKRKKLPRPG